MKKKAFILTGSLVVVLIALICVIVLLGPKKGVESNTGILSISSRAELKNYIEENDIKSYGIDKESAWINSIELFESNADVELFMSNDVVDEINIKFSLFQNDSETEYENAEDVPNDVPIYQFTDGDKSEIAETFELIKKQFENHLSCSFENYDIVPIINFEDIENNEDSFFNGSFLKEYSVRDSNGILWIMRYEASYGSASVVIHKLIDETGFEGFVPAIDMTKK